MQSKDEIIGFIRSKVATYKATNDDNVDIYAPLLESIGLIGDDFSEIDYLLEERYGVNTRDSDYFEDMTISDWAGIISKKVDELKLR